MGLNSLLIFSQMLQNWPDCAPPWRKWSKTYRESNQRSCSGREMERPSRAQSTCLTFQNGWCNIWNEGKKKNYSPITSGIIRLYSILSLYRLNVNCQRISPGVNVDRGIRSNRENGRLLSLVAVFCVTMALLVLNCFSFFETVKFSQSPFSWLVKY